MRGRLSSHRIFVLPYIVLILVSLAHSRPSKLNFAWTSVERVSRSLKTSEEMPEQHKQIQLPIALVSGEADNAEGRRKGYSNLGTNLSKDEIKKLGKQTFDLLKPANSNPEVIIDPPLKTDQMRLDEWEQKHQQHHNKNKGHQKAPEWFNNRINATESHGCVGSPFSQKVELDGCETKYILNRFCHGACASIYIPEIRSKKLKAVFSNCLVCRPADVEHIQVRLECLKGSMVRNVIRVKRCECQEHDAPLPS